MIDISLTDFLSIPESEKIKYIKDTAVLFAQQYDRAELDYLCDLSDACRKLRKNREGADFMANLLSHKTALNFFVQPSSRTFLSFNMAQSILGMRRISLRDAKISSISKGETLADSIRTFLSYVDLIVMRHSDADAVAVAFWIAAKSHRYEIVRDAKVPLPIISGGAGTQQHPTQALLDIYTLRKSLESVGGIDGKKIMLVGDLKRGRTVRSLSYLMKNYSDVTLYFAAPKEYQMEQDILDFCEMHSIKYKMINSIEEGIREVDAVYMTRIQDEWDGLAPGVGHVKASDAFVFKKEYLDIIKPHCCLLHPLPKRDEIEEEIDYLDDKRVVYWRQERNGMWMRVAIIAKLFGVDKDIFDKLNEIC
jgi:aspartate carbamoyltransferase catalytic subunit